MNWYIKNIEKSYKDKNISGLTDSGNFVAGKFDSVKPDAVRGYILVIKDQSNNIHNIKAANVRKISELKENKEEPIHNVKGNFCGMIYSGESPKANKDYVQTRVMTTKEPHSLKKMTIVVPSTHITNETK